MKPRHINIKGYIYIDPGARGVLLRVGGQSKSTLYLSKSNNFKKRCIEGKNK